MASFFSLRRQQSAKNSRRRKTRRGVVECLENRQLLATDVTLFADSFETGSNSNDWGGSWGEDIQNDWFTSTQRATDGVRSAEVDGYANNATLTMNNAVDVSGYNSAELTFDWLIENGFDSGEFLALDISANGGVSWTTDVLRLNGNSSSENTWHSETVDLTNYASSDLLVRFRTKVSRSNEDANVDNVKITGKLAALPSVSVADATATEGMQGPSEFVDAFVSAQSGGLTAPHKIKLGPDGTVYVTSQTTNSVMSYDGVSGAWLGEFIAPGDGGLDNPRDLVFDSRGDLLVSSRNNNQIIRFSGDDGSFDRVLVDGTGGLNVPQNMTYQQETDELLVSSAQSDEILKFDGLTGQFLGAFVSTGSGGLSNPKGLTLTDSGALLVVSQLGDQILKYDSEGQFDSVFYSVPAQSASTTILMDLAWNLDGSLLVTEDSDVNGGRVLRLDASSGAFLDEYVSVGSGGLNDVRGLTVDSFGAVLVVSKASNEVLRYAPASLAEFTVSLTAESDQPITVDFASLDGTAVGGSDYRSVSGTIVFEPGVTSRTILVPSFDDSIDEEDETFSLQLSNVSPQATFLVANAVGTIVDDDVANQPPTADAGQDLALSDNDGTGSETATLSGSGVDSDGVITGYQWSQGTTILGNTSSITTLLSVGVHTLTMTVTDNEGGTASDSVAVTVAANQMPTASAGADQALTDQNDDGSEVVVLVGSAADDDGSIASYVWSDGLSVIGTTASISPTLDVGTHELTLTVTDNGGATSSDSVTVVIKAAASAGPNLSHGNLLSVGSTWQTVTLGKTYSSMVVVATPRYNTGSAPGVVRVQNASGNRFDVRVDNAGSSDFDGGVHFIVVEEGVYDEAGFKLEAVKYSEAQTSGKNGWAINTTEYQQPYSLPVVVGQVMSANDENFSVFWASSSSRTAPPSSSGLNVGKHVAEDTNTVRSTETIGYIVIEATQNGTIEGLPFVAGVGRDTVRGVGNGTFQYTYDAMPNAKTAVLSTAGMDGGDGGWAVLMGSNPVPPTTGTLSLSVDEDQRRDSERNHTTEQVAYFVIDPPPADGEVVDDWHGSLQGFTRHQPADVNGDGQLSPMDALLVINRLNMRKIDPFGTFESGDMALDTNGDGHISSIDALIVVNRINAISANIPAASGAEGEQAADAFFAFDDEDEPLEQTF